MREAYSAVCECTDHVDILFFGVEFVLWLFSCLLKLLALPECEGLHQRIAECLDGILRVSNTRYEWRSVNKFYSP